MDEVQPDPGLSFWASLAKKLQPRDYPSRRLRIGRRGVYLIDGGEKVTSFRLIAWQQLLADTEGSDNHGTELVP